MPSEREKMLAGELYRATDPELAEAHLRAQRIVTRYNATLPDEAETRATLLGGDDAVVGAGSVVTADVPAGEVVVGNPARPRRPSA
jgi:maltose O-acetyltransferase